MTLLINNDVVSRVLVMDDALDAIERALAQMGDGLAAFQCRTDFWSPTSALGDYYRWGSLLGATYDPPTLALRFKSDNLVWTEHPDGSRTEDWFCVRPGTYCGFVLLFDTSSGELIAMMNDGVLQHVRVGATAGIGVKYAARKDARHLGILGSGGMARAYAEAIGLVRKLETVRVYSPTKANRERFAREMSSVLGVEIEPVHDVRAAVEGADIAALCTDSMVPVFSPDMLEDGVTIVTVRDEVELGVYDSASRVLSTHGEAVFDYTLGPAELRSKKPSGEFARRKYSPRRWDRLLPDIVCGRTTARESAHESILFRNNSFGVQFAAVGRLVYERAQASGLGTPLPSEWFLQDIRN